MDVKKYLGYVLDLEKEIRTIQEIIDELTRQSRSLGIATQFPEPKWEDPDEEFTLGNKLFFSICISPVGAVIAIIIGTIAEFFVNGDFTSFGIMGKGMLIVALICFGGMTIVECLGKDERRKRIEKQNEKEAQKHKEAVQRDKQRVQMELKKKQTLNLQIEGLRHKKAELSTTLNKMYGINILYPKYRYFVAVATMYEYFDSGRCRTLEGHEGAYNVYENELRLNVIVSQLSDIIYRLEDIKSNQMMVYNAIKEGNRLSNEICNNSARLIQQNQEIMENTALIAYNSRITAKNTEIMKFITLYH